MTYFYSTRLWRAYWRPLVLSQEPYCVGYPTEHHGGALVRTEQVDHIMPRGQGGPTTRENLRGLCASCNRRKSMDEGARTWR